MFTLYELQKELSKMGHGYNLNEIKEAIQVCRGATLECISDDGEAFISSSFFPMVGLTTRGEFRKKGGNARCYVQFNPLVNESIMNLSFRQYNYKIGMQIRSSCTVHLQANEPLLDSSITRFAVHAIAYQLPDPEPS